MTYEMLAAELDRLGSLARRARTSGDWRYIESRASSLPGARADRLVYRAVSAIDTMQAFGLGSDRAEA